MRRVFWILFGAAVQILFGYTVVQLFAILYAGSGDLLNITHLPGALTGRWQPGTAGQTTSARVAWDLLLLLQFAVAHSLFVWPPVRRALERVVPKQLYGSFYTFVASVTVLVTVAFWQPLPQVVFETRGALAWSLLLAFLASWGLLMYSISLTGFGWQTGLTPWWSYVRNRASPRWSFVTHGAYCHLRHPIYLSFLLLLWMTPRMTADHLLLAGTWTVYVFVGSVLKDRRMLDALGERYRAYMAEVPGYPLVPWGPLGKVRRAHERSKTRDRRVGTAPAHRP